MKVGDIGERALIARFARPPRAEDIALGIGDDCAVVSTTPPSDRLLLHTADMLIEGAHFDLRYFSAADVGVKAMESNISDVVACGGRPRYALLSLGLPASLDVAFVDRFFEGVYDVADRCDVEIIGGDLSRADRFIVSVALTGETSRESLRLRSVAEPGDLVVVSGPLGGSEAGLRLLRGEVEGFERVERMHTRPRSRLDLLEAIAPVAKAMTDISDGLATDVANLCVASGVSARLERAAIPLDEDVAAAANALGDDPLDYALFGGEDFELLYTVAPKDRAAITGEVVGVIAAGEGVFVDGARLERFGYDHFAH